MIRGLVALCVVVLVVSIRDARNNSPTDVPLLASVDEESSMYREHPVHLLVTRHAVTCATIVEEWVSSFDFGRSFLTDPPLGGMGVYTSQKAREEVNDWLKEKQLSLDAVLSSNMGRAMETAFHMYPSAASPLYVVPYIRDDTKGESNKPAKKSDQITNLVRVLGGVHNLSVDYHWIGVHGGDPGTWDGFLSFLRQQFLPTLVARLDKPNGSPIVLGVVTHSHHMRDSRIGEQCNQFWKRRGSTDDKPFNNQVLDMTYIFTKSHLGGADVTPNYKLREVGPFCSEVTGDEPMKNIPSAHPKLCLRDVGNSCLGPIMRNSFLPEKLLSKTFEHEIVNIAQEIMTVNKNVEDGDKTFKGISDEKTKLEKLLEQHGGQITCQGSGGDCSPSGYCQRRGDNCNVREQFRTERIAKLATQEAQITPRLAEDIEKLRRLKEKIEELKVRDCWTGGRPEPLRLPKAEHLVLQFGEGVKQLLLPNKPIYAT
mmetsp:Transcript_65740/g.129542  ORF Transcript_65740/g.129542 Transcript_65740/m.129542 type:complete len:483 (+) Transcript_65740:93-1541(+)